MKIRTLMIAASISMGTTIYLTETQAHARKHLLSKGEGKAAGKGKNARKPYVANALLSFKAGEEIGVVGKLDRRLESAFESDANDDEQASDVKVDELSDLETKIEAAKSELKDIADKASEAKAEQEKATKEAKEKHDEVLVELAKVNAELETAKSDLADTQQELAGAIKAIEEAKEDLANLEEELETKTSDGGDDQDSSDENPAS